MKSRFLKNFEKIFLLTCDLDKVARKSDALSVNCAACQIASHRMSRPDRDMSDVRLNLTSRQRLHVNLPSISHSPSSRGHTGNRVLLRFSRSKIEKSSILISSKFKVKISISTVWKRPKFQVRSEQEFNLRFVFEQWRHWLWPILVKKFVVWVKTSNCF